MGEVMRTLLPLTRRPRAMALVQVGRREVVFPTHLLSARVRSTHKTDPHLLAPILQMQKLRAETMVPGKKLNPGPPD